MLKNCLLIFFSLLFFRFVRFFSLGGGVISFRGYFAVRRYVVEVYVQTMEESFERKLGKRR